MDLSLKLAGFTSPNPTTSEQYFCPTPRCGVKEFWNISFYFSYFCIICLIPVFIILSSKCDKAYTKASIMKTVGYTAAHGMTFQNFFVIIFYIGSWWLLKSRNEISYFFIRLIYDNNLWWFWEIRKISQLAWHFTISL